MGRGSLSCLPGSCRKRAKDLRGGRGRGPGGRTPQRKDVRPQRGKLVALICMAAAICVAALALKHFVEVELDLYKLQRGTLPARNSK